jgi:hypothetical protein
MAMKSTWGSAAQGRNMRVKGEATAFRLWKFATLLGWDCTIGECARAAGINETTAKMVIRRKGWAYKFNCDAANEARSGGARKGNAKRHQHTHSDAVDVYDMMELGR